MVSLQVIRASNALLKTTLSTQSPTAVFVGATSGIGLATLKAFAQSTESPKAYICGRSYESFQPHLEALRESNSSARFEFLQAEVSLMTDVDRVCKEIMTRESRIDALWLSCGVLKFGARDDTSEGLHMPLALSYFTRLRFVHNLLPVLNKSSSPRVISILGAGLEKEIDANDIEVRNGFTAMKAAQIAPTLNTLAFEEIAQTNPKISFIHKYPGFVNTGSISRLLSTFTGPSSVLASIASLTLLPLANIFATSATEAGERGLYLLTSSRYRRPTLGQPQREGGIEEGGNGHIKDENGVFRLAPKDDSVVESKTLARYREGGVGEKIWMKTQEVWSRCMGTA